MGCKINKSAVTKKKETDAVRKQRLDTAIDLPPYLVIISNRVDIEVEDAAKVMRIFQNKTARAQLV